MSERDDEDEDGLGGDEPFCQHGNLLWSEDCDECDAELQRISDQITAASKEPKWAS